MNAKTSRLLTAVLSCGTLGACLRLLMYRIGFDEKNILSASHPLHLFCLGMTAMLAVYLLLHTSRLKGSSDPNLNFPRSGPRQMGLFSAGCLMTLHALTLTEETSSLLALCRMLLAFGSAGGMVLCALFPGKLRRVHIVCRGMICLFFALDMLARYQVWSGNPQLPDYVFQVLACVTLCLCSYHRLAFDTGLGKRRTLLFTSLMAIYLNLLCAAGPETPIFYLGGALWAAGCICTAETPPEQEGQSDVPA